MGLLQQKTGAEAHWDKVRASLPPMSEILARIPKQPPSVFIEVHAVDEHSEERDVERFKAARLAALEARAKANAG
jgi:hypothetical protein